MEPVEKELERVEARLIRKLDTLTAKVEALSDCTENGKDTSTKPGPTQTSKQSSLTSGSKAEDD
jgi:hypothetical protein